MTLKVGETYTFNVSENPTTGFTWNIHPESTDNGFFTVSTDYIKDAVQNCQGCTGIGGGKSIIVKAVASGTATLAADHARPWETDMRAIDSFSI